MPSGVGYGGRGYSNHTCLPYNVDIYLQVGNSEIFL